jgi:hypothetical protein
MGWLALRTQDARAVVQSLRLSNPHETSWGAGLLALEDQWDAERGEAVGSGREPTASGPVCFVTPAVRGWTFVLGPFRWGISWRYQEREALITKLSQPFGEVQSFLTDRIPEIHHWMRASEGVLLRSVAYDGEKGLIWSDYGALTPVEEELQWTQVYAHQWVPSEEVVMRVAGAWSLNPTTLDTISAEAMTSVGVLARLPTASLLDRYSLLAPHPPTALVDPTATLEWS